MENKSYSLYKPENPIVSEAYSMLAGSIYVEAKEKGLKALVVASNEPRVGKTAVATSIAITIATWGKRTVLIDADMRKPIDRKQNNLGSACGLYQYLQGIISLEQVLYPTNVENLKYIPNGRVTTNPMGLLCSEGLEKLFNKASECFDYIVIDTPALGSVSDAAIISSKADAVLLVAKMGATRLDVIKKAKEQLEKNNSNILGVVVNEVAKKTYKKYFESYKYFHNLNKKAIKDKETNRKAVIKLTS